MKTLKNISIILLVAFGFCACDSLLDVETKHALPQEEMENEEGARSLIIGVYDRMQEPTYAGRDFLTLPDVMGDNVKLNPGATRYTRQYQFTPYYNIDIWDAAYSQIVSLNEALYYLSKLEETPSVKALKGEALFLRAYDYFYLASIYGRMPGHLVDGFDLCVPLIKEPFFNNGGNISEEASVARDKVDVVWAQIVDDLNEAFELMNGNDKGNFPNRASAIAAKALLSRVYLYMGRWSDCVTASTYVLNNSPAKIYSGKQYTSIFSSGSESIWQLHYTEAENLLSSSLHSAYGTKDDGVRDDEGYGNGKGTGDAVLSVTDEFVALLDQENDIRFGALRKVKYSGLKLWWTIKFNSWKKADLFGLDDVPLIRISEILLNRAEAYAHQNTMGSARADINDLRGKRGIGDTDVPDSGLLDEILLQRRIELAFEGHRYFDRKRLGLDILRPEGLPSIPYSDYRVVAAIGTTELDVNKLLVQNPGY
ncbi:MAG: RagB/SusD family nutrient uptake outer membrane protein [Bacteroidales bacterium]|nr:RagB/SusD family nutrient uptake outer membrane protein [Bacteroidales bacterium]